MSFSCNKECDNGGYCTLVDRVNGENNGDGFVIIQNGDGDYINFVEQCVCMPGYKGSNCETSIPECTLSTVDGGFVCNNGSPCSDDINSISQCDCSEARQLSRFAEYMCRRPATERCGNGKSAAKAFCTNGGSCLTNLGHARNASNPFQHVGCQCPPEFEGPHCEMLLGTMDKLSDNEGSPNTINGKSSNLINEGSSGTLEGDSLGAFVESSTRTNEDGSLNLLSEGSLNTNGNNPELDSVDKTSNGNNTEKTLLLISSSFLFVLIFIIIAFFVYKIRRGKKDEQRRKPAQANEEGLMRGWAPEDGRGTPEGHATSELVPEYLYEDDRDMEYDLENEQPSSQAGGFRSVFSSAFSSLSPIEEEKRTSLRRNDSTRGANIERAKGPGGYRITFDDDYDQERYLGEYGRAKNGHASRTKTYV